MATPSKETRSYLKVFWGNHGSRIGMETGRSERKGTGAAGLARVQRRRDHGSRSGALVLLRGLALSVAAGGVLGPGLPGWSGQPVTPEHPAACVDGAAGGGRRA